MCHSITSVESVHICPCPSPNLETHLHMQPWKLACWRTNMRPWNLKTLKAGCIVDAFSWILDTVWIRIEQNVCCVTTNPQSGVTSDVCVLVFVPPWTFQGSPRRGWKFAWWWDREGCKGEFALPLVISSYWRMLSSAIEVRGSQTGPLWTGWLTCLPSAECFHQRLRSGDHKVAQYG